MSADSIEIEADGRDETVERFYRDIMLLAGARTGRSDGAFVVVGFHP